MVHVLMGNGEDIHGHRHTKQGHVTVVPETEVKHLQSRER